MITDVSAPNSEEWILLGTVPSKDDQSAQLYQVRGVEIVVVRHAGVWVAFDNKCPHAAAPLSDGLSTQGTVTCGRHGWTFDLISGERIGNWGGTGNSALHMRSIVDKNGMLYLKQPLLPQGIVENRLLVRFGVPGWIAKVRDSSGLNPQVRDHVLIRTGRGVEVGELLAIAPHGSPKDGNGELLQVLSEADNSRKELLKRKSEELLNSARLVAQKRKLSQDFVDAETLWDGTATVIYYLGAPGPELGDLADYLAQEAKEQIQFQPLIDHPSPGGCGCGTGGCGS